MPDCRAIGITMRESVSASGEVRDALADDWGRLMQQVLPGVRWLPVPNLGAKNGVEFAQHWALDGLVLSGGEDVGSSARRDSTERALLAWFRDRRLPVLAVCRGFQLLWTELGGTLQAIESHAGVRHGLRPVPGSAAGIGAGTLIPAQVGSYHRWGAAASPPLAQGVEVLAHDEDGRVEAFRVRAEPTFAVMWHPEREPVARATESLLFQLVFREPSP